MKISYNKCVKISLIFIFVMGLFLFPFKVFADDIKVSSSVSADKIGIEDSFNYTISVETNSNQNLDVDVKFDNFPADYLRPSISTSMSTSFINGRMSSSRTQSHKYTVYPRQEGILKIPQVKVEVNGKTYRTQSHSIEVVAGSIRPKTQTRSRNRSPFSSFFDSEFDDFGTSRSNSDSFVEVEVSNDSIYVGQDIQAKYTYYTSNNRNNISYDMQAFDGYGYDSSSNDNESWQRVNYKGKNYYQIEITSLKITAQRAGTITLPIITVNESRFLTSNTSKSPSKKVLVKELPSQGKAIDFSNAIGQFSIEAKLNQPVMFDNQQNQLVVTIEGKGNFAKILYPQFPPVAGLEILKPKATLDYDESGEGALVLHYDIIPYESGKFKIPALSFNYFDDKEGEYKTIYSESTILTIKSRSSNGEDIERDQFNVLYSKNKPYLGNIKSEYLLINNLSYWLTLLLVIAAIIFYLIFYRIYQRKINDLTYVRKKEALALLKKAINESEELVKKHDILFYTNAQNHLLKFISKITKTSLQLSQSQLIEELKKSHVNNVTVDKIDSFLTYCEQVKYRPNFQSSENIEKDYQKFVDIFNEIKNIQG